MPAPKTESAREAARTFYCELCTKGYARMPEYEAHLSSYEHTHNQRRRDAKQFHKNPFGKDLSESARKNEEKEKKAAGMTSVKVDNAGASAKLSGGGFKKGGFKSAGFKKVGGPAKEAEQKPQAIPGLPRTSDAAMLDDDDEFEGEDMSNDYSFWHEKDPGYSYYNPFKPGGCDVRCPCRTAKNEQCSGQSCDLCEQLGPVPG